MNEVVPSQQFKKSSMDEYLTNERKTGARNEFFNGKVVGRSGSNRWHNLIVSNIAVGAGSRLHGHKSEMYISGMRVKLTNNCISYPDIAIVNGEPSFADGNQDLLLNPTVLIEIVSNEMHSAAKTTKIENYLAMQSIRECLLIKEDEMRIEHFAKQNAKQWIYKIYNERDDVVTLESIGTKISLQEIYSNIKLRHAELSSRAVN
jgi:Uma2 family endonuclease